MTRELAVGILLGVALLLLVVMLFAWRRRVRRDSGIPVPLGVPEHAEVLERHEVLYVATTPHDQPLERLALTSLAFRARGELALTDRGVALSLDGSPTVFLASVRLVGVDRATVAIDRVVEPGGLIRVTWRLDDGALADSYLRLTTGDSAHVISAIRRLCAAPETGVSS